MDRRTKVAVALVVTAGAFVFAGIVTGRLSALIVGVICAIVALALAVWSRKP